MYRWRVDDRLAPKYAALMQILANANDVKVRHDVRVLGTALCLLYRESEGPRTCWRGCRAPSQ